MADGVDAEAGEAMAHFFEIVAGHDFFVAAAIGASSHVWGSLSYSSFVRLVQSQGKIKVRGVGQECPTHTGIRLLGMAHRCSLLRALRRTWGRSKRQESGCGSPNIIGG